MRSSGELKQIAKNALRGKWLLAAVVGLIAALIGGSSGLVNTVIEPVLEVYVEDTFWVNTQLEYWVLDLIVNYLFAVTIWTIVCLFIGGAGRLGYVTFNLHLIDGKTIAFKDLFSQFHLFWKAFLMNLLIALFTLLWSLLLVIPGIIKGYAYAMAPYILSENPELSASDAISHSDSIMTGHKWDLFLLELSFIGWYLLAFVVLFMCGFGAIFFSVMVGELFSLVLLLFLTIGFGVGMMFLRAYYEAAHAAFYRELCPAKLEVPLTLE